MHHSSSAVFFLLLRYGVVCPFRVARVQCARLVRRLSDSPLALQTIFWDKLLGISMGHFCSSKRVKVGAAGS